LLVITAHYDHLGKKDTLIYHGADDDGSGTSAVIELAKVFNKAKHDGHGPRRSILFMTVSGEEKGLLGSSYYVEHPLFPLSQTVADLNIDMIGRTDPKHDSLGIRNYIYIIGSDKLSTQLHRINENANMTYTKLDLDYTYNSPGDKHRFYYRSDHYNFAKNNIPVIFYFNGTHADYHRPTDTIDKIDFDLLAKRAQLVFFTAWDLANRDERIKVDVKSDFEEKK
jgi:Zn-dependent M28 family amino/carboxypeptidase